MARRVRKSIEEATETNGNVLECLPASFDEAAALLADRRKEYADREQDFWNCHRPQSRSVVEAYERFHAVAKAVGLVKGSRGRR